jgi:NitT/TauT family transport system substrate-binding protein
VNYDLGEDIVLWYQALNKQQQLAVCLAVTLLAAGGCTGSDEPARPGPVDEVTYVTGLGLTGREGAPFVAQAKGYFADEHITVTVKPGQAGEFNLQALRSGQAQFAAIDYAGAVVRAGTGTFDDLRCIEVVQQKTVAAIMALDSSGIRTARDLPGKTVGVTPGSAIKTLFPAYGRLAGLDPAQIRQVRWVDVTTGLPALLAAGKVDAVALFVPAKPTVSAAAKGAPVTMLPYSDYMSDLYGTVIAARTDVDPDLQRRFTRALFRGLRYMVDHPQEAGQIIHAAVPDTPAAAATAEIQLLTGYVGSPQATPELVARSVALLQGIGMIPAAVDPQKVFDFTVAPSAAPSAGGR